MVATRSRSMCSRTVSVLVQVLLIVPPIVRVEEQ